MTDTETRARNAAALVSASHTSATWTGRRKPFFIVHPFVWLHWAAVGLARKVCPHRASFARDTCAICGLTGMQVVSWHRSAPTNYMGYRIGSRVYYRIEL